MDIADAGADGVGHVVFPFHFHESHRIGARVLRGFLDCGPGLAEESLPRTPGDTESDTVILGNVLRILSTYQDIPVSDFHHMLEFGASPSLGNREHIVCNCTEIITDVESE